MICFEYSFSRKLYYIKKKIFLPMGGEEKVYLTIESISLI